LNISSQQQPFYGYSTIQTSSGPQPPKNPLKNSSLTTFQNTNSYHQKYEPQLQQPLLQSSSKNPNLYSNPLYSSTSHFETPRTATTNSGGFYSAPPMIIHNSLARGRPSNSINNDNVMFTNKLPPVPYKKSTSKSRNNLLLNLQNNSSSNSNLNSLNAAASAALNNQQNAAFKNSNSNIIFNNNGLNMNGATVVGSPSSTSSTSSNSSPASHPILMNAANNNNNNNNNSGSLSPLLASDAANIKNINTSSSLSSRTSNLLNNNTNQSFFYK
jgi:hypothetical protein